MSLRSFSRPELEAIEDDARAVMLDRPFDATHWLGLVIDLSRELRHQQEGDLILATLQRHQDGANER